MDKSEVKAAAKWLAVATVVAMLQALRFAVFMVLLTFSGIICRILGFFSGACALCFCILMVMGRFDLPAWAFLGFGIGSMVALWVYNGLLTLLAPDGWIIGHEM